MLQAKCVQTPWCSAWVTGSKFSFSTKRESCTGSRLPVGDSLVQRDNTCSSFHNSDKQHPSISLMYTNNEHTKASPPKRPFTSFRSHLAQRQWQIIINMPTDDKRANVHLGNPWSPLRPGRAAIKPVVRILASALIQHMPLTPTTLGDPAWTRTVIILHDSFSVWGVQVTVVGTDVSSSYLWRASIYV